MGNEGIKRRAVMRCVRTFQTDSTVKKIHIRKISKPISHTFSEDEIIKLQNEILTNGLHEIGVDSVSAGRAFMYTFLHTLNCFKKIACITDSVLALHQAENIYKKLKHIPFPNQEAWQAFFVEDFYYDFIWLESTSSLSPWLEQFKNMLEAHGIEKQIPVMYLNYN